MSRTWKTDPSFVKRRRAKKFSQWHRCRQHRAPWQISKLNDTCSLSDEPQFYPRYDQRFWSGNCSWHAELTFPEQAKFEAAHPGMRNERWEWHQHDRRAARDTNHAMMREWNGNGDVNDDIARVDKHNHSGRWDW